MKPTHYIGLILLFVTNRTNAQDLTTIKIDSLQSLIIYHNKIITHHDSIRDRHANIVYVLNAEIAAINNKNAEFFLNTMVASCPNGCRLFIEPDDNSREILIIGKGHSIEIQMDGKISNDKGTYYRAAYTLGSNSFIGYVEATELSGNSLQLFSGTHDAIPDKARQIVIQYQSDSQAFENGLRMLKKWGFQIENHSREMGYINTKFSEELAINATVNNNNLIFSGKWLSLGFSEQMACYCGNRVGDYRKKNFFKMKSLVDSEGVRYSYRQ